MPILLIVICWLMVFLGNKCFKKKIWFNTYSSKFNTCLHKMHEISILYISMATILEWIYFDAASFERWLSFGLCLIFNVYFIAYELYIYYDMIKYPLAKIGNQKYEFYLNRYSTFLKNIRFE